MSEQLRSATATSTLAPIDEPETPTAEAVLTARQRVESLFDVDASVVEYGAKVTPISPDLDAPSDGVIVAMGTVHGRPTLAISYDGQADHGSHGSTGHVKVARGLSFAGYLNAAVVLFSEGGGFRPSEPAYYTERRDLVSQLIELSGRVPIIGVAVGPVADIRALELGVADVIMGVRGASISLDEPGPSSAEHTEVTVLEREGGVDLVLDDAPAAVQAVRRYLDFFAAANRLPLEPDDPAIAEALRKVVPENPRRAIDGRRLTDLVADPGTALRLRERFGGSLQTSLARVGGRAVGIIASHSMVNAGAIDSPASDKFARFLTLCDTFGLPLVYLTDVPGLLAGPVAEQTAMNRHSTRPYFVQTHSRVPQLVVVARRAYGQGMVVMGMGGHVPGRALQVLWPSAEFGGMGLGGAAAITASSTNSANATGGRSEEELYRELMEQGSASRMAERFGTDDTIEPGETRERLLAAIALLPVFDQVRQPRKPIDSW
jgi:acetyl-CoA carboxylase carboxyltransferase component